MHQNFLIPGFAVVVSMILMVAGANAQAVSLPDQLAAQYKLVKMGSDSSGYSVVEEGTLLAIQKGGLKGVPYSETNTLLANRYEGGTVYPPSFAREKVTNILRSHIGRPEQTTRLFQKSEKVYPSKIDVNPDKDTVTIAIVACDTCNKTDPPTYNKANVVFVFPKGSLAKASAGQVEDTIGQLLSISTDAP
jgi:hypothetical protein